MNNPGVEYFDVVLRFLVFVLVTLFLIVLVLFLVFLYASPTPSHNFPSLYYIISTFLPALWGLSAFYHFQKYPPQPPSFVIYLKNIAARKVDRLPEMLEKKGFRIFIICLTLIISFLLWRFGIFSAGIITNNDHAYHYYQAWFMAKYLLPHFQSAIGWSPYFYAGFPIMYHYHPGNALFTSLLYLISSGTIPLSFAYRIFFTLALLAAPLSTYFLAKQLRLGETTCTIIGLLSIVPTFRHVEMLYWGLTSCILAAGISPLVFAFLHKYFQTKERMHLFVASTLLGAIIITHSIIALAVVLGIILYLLLKKEVNRTVVLCMFVIPLLLSAFWVIPSIQYFLNGYGSLEVTDPHLKVKTMLGFINFHVFLILGIPALLWPFIYLGYRRAYASGSFPERFILLYTALLYITAYYGALIPGLQELQLLHLMPYLGIYLIMAAGMGISAALKNGPYRRFAVIALLVALISPLMGTLLFSLSINPEAHTILSIGLPTNVEAVFAWIKENDANRILLEDTDSLLMKAPWGRGFRLALAPVYAEKARFIGGAEPFYNPFWTGNRTRTGEGVFFGLSLNNTAREKVVQNLDDFNIQHLIVWSNESKKFLDDSADFELVKKIDWFSIYRYKNARKSFVVRTFGDVSANVTEFGVKEIVLWVRANETSQVTVSSSYYPNWHAYADGREIPLKQDGMFSQVVVPPKDTPYEVSLVFEESELERYSMWVSLLCWLFVGFFLVFNLTRKFVIR